MERDRARRLRTEIRFTRSFEYLNIRSRAHPVRDAFGKTTRSMFSQLRFRHSETVHLPVHISSSYIKKPPAVLTSTPRCEFYYEAADCAALLNLLGFIDRSVSIKFNEFSS